MNKILVTENDMLSTLAFWAISECPTNIPRKLEIVLEKFKDEIRKDFDDYDNDFYYYDFESHIDIRKWLTITLFKIQEFKEWNLSENEYNNGVSVDNKKNIKIEFKNAYDIVDPKDNFINLNVLIKNMTKHLIEISESYRI